MARGQRHLRGLFIGGTFAEEAMTLAASSVGDIRSNAPLRPELKLGDSRKAEGHAIIDLGDEEFTRGRAHPGIDPAPIKQAILREGADPGLAVLLMDFILGPALNPDPAGSVIAEIRKIRGDREAAGGYIAVVAAVCGTESDPQNLAEQERILREAGVVLMPSNGQAARLAGLIAKAAGGQR
jgi:FdrA protein